MYSMGIFHPIEETQIYQPVFRQPPGKKAAYRDRSHCTIHNTDRAFFILSTKFLVTLSFRLLFALPLPSSRSILFSAVRTAPIPRQDKTRFRSHIIYEGVRWREPGSLGDGGVQKKERKKTLERRKKKNRKKDDQQLCKALAGGRPQDERHWDQGMEILRTC